MVIEGRQRVARKAASTTLMIISVIAANAGAPTTAQTILNRLLAKALHSQDDRARPKAASTPSAAGGSADDAGAGSPPDDSSLPTNEQAAMLKPSAARPSPPPPVSGPLSLDVAGVRLGMPYNQLQGTLASSYRCKILTMTKSFAQRVSEEVGRRRGNVVYQDGRGLGEVNCKGPLGEDLTIDIAHGLTGPVVDKLRLDVSHDRVDGASVLRQVRGKFGPPSNGTPSNGCWTTAASDCVAIPPIGPRMRAFDTIDRVVIMGDRGERAARVDEAAVQAAADRIAPRRSGAAL